MPQKVKFSSKTSKKKDDEENKPKFQDLPESKYPRSYTPRMEAEIRRVGGQKSGEISGGSFDVKNMYQKASVPTHLFGNEPTDKQKEWDAHLSVGEKKIAGSKKKGGPINRTGLYKLHAGEYVVPKNKDMDKDEMPPKKMPMKPKMKKMKKGTKLKFSSKAV